MPAYLHNCLIIGSCSRAESLCNQLEETRGLHVVGFVETESNLPVAGNSINRMVGTIDDLEQILMRFSVDQVYIALSIKASYRDILRSIAICEKAGIEAALLFDVFDCSLARLHLDNSQRLPLLHFRMTRHHQRLFWKRALDIVGATSGLLLLGPLMFLIALAIVLTSDGPALFVQDRYGYHRRRFGMYKFRTMVRDAEAQQSSLEILNEKSGPIFKIRNDPRVTPLGKLLRVSSLDELPQLFNVLIGNMSLVGPRPMSVRDVARFDDLALMRRFSVKPGMTCLWQIHGRSNIEFPEWLALDLKYIDSWSLGLDLQILAKTIPAVVVGKGAL
jgi:exopolysaccharide biosynthesis polyprenyl glycosylphosphotransferase